MGRRWVRCLIFFYQHFVPNGTRDSFLSSQNTILPANNRIVTCPTRDKILVEMLVIFVEMYIFGWYVYILIEAYFWYCINYLLRPFRAFDLGISQSVGRFALRY